MQQHPKDDNPNGQLQVSSLKGMFVKSRKDLFLEQDTDKFQRLSQSNPTSVDKAKKYSRSKGYDSSKTVETKFDLNFALDPLSLAGNSHPHSSFFVKSSKNDSSKHTILLPKLAHNVFDGEIPVKVPSMNSDKVRSLERLSIRVSKNRANNETLADQNTNLQDLLGDIKTHEVKKPSIFSLVDDIEKDEHELQKQVSALKAQVSNMKWKINSLEKENLELREQVKVYRDLVAENNMRDVETLLKERSQVLDVDGTKSSRGLATGQANKEQGVKPVDPSIHERLSNIFRAVSKYNSLAHTLNAAVVEACKAFDCNYARIVLTDDQIKKICLESTTEKIKIEKVLLGNVEVDVIERKEDISSAFGQLDTMDSVDILKKPINNDKKEISIPIGGLNDPEELWGAIQVTEPTITSKNSKTKRPKGFSVKDEVLLATYAKILSLLVATYQREWLLREQEKKICIYNETMGCLVGTRTHQELLDAAKVKLPSFTGFEGVGILFYEPKEDLLYTFDTQKKPDGKFHMREPIRYPAKLGISGKCLTHEVDLIAVNEPRKNKEFQPEIDNTAGGVITKNILIVLIKDEKGKKVGILQLVNKCNNQHLSQKDEMTARSLQQLLGALISHVNEVSTAINLSSAMSQTMKNIEDRLYY